MEKNLAFLPVFLSRNIPYDQFSAQDTSIQLKTQVQIYFSDNIVRGWNLRSELEKKVEYFTVKFYVPAFYKNEVFLWYEEESTITSSSKHNLQFQTYIGSNLIIFHRWETFISGLLDMIESYFQSAVSWQIIEHFTVHGCFWLSVLGPSLLPEDFVVRELTE